METIARAYDIVFYERADPRVKDMTFMRSPWPLFTVAVTYLALVKIFLPAYMKNRKAYDLSTIIKLYNIIQIVSNAVVCWGIVTSGWTTTYHFGCMLPDYSNSPEAIRMLHFMWWTVVLKLFELIETAFFILRKRERQASFLHVYHHVSTLILIWVGTKYAGGGMVSFPALLNTMIHVIMYSYYLLSAEGSPKVKAFLRKYKKWLTAVQMVQFTIMLVYGAQIFLPSCPIDKGIAYVYFPNVIFVYFMFYDFYKQNYSSQKKASLNVNGAKKEG